MSWPPSILRLRVRGDSGRQLRLWLPLFILWPLAAALAILALPILAVAALLTRRGSRPRTLLCALPAVLPAICAARGLTVKVEDPAHSVYIALR